MKKELFNEDEMLPFSGAQFKAAWEDWKSHRKEMKKPITPTTAKYQLRKLKEMGEAKAIQSIGRSIECGWMGLFEPIADVNPEGMQPGELLAKRLGL